MTSSKAQTTLKITDTTLRDAHQSLAATRMRTSDMEPIAAEMDKAGFWSAEVWGGATFDVTTRFLAEDPWERVRVLKRLMPTPPSRCSCAARTWWDTETMLTTLWWPLWSTPPRWA